MKGLLEFLVYSPRLRKRYSIALKHLAMITTLLCTTACFIDEKRDVRGGIDETKPLSDFSESDSSSYSIQHAYFDEGVVTLSVSYSGGCKKHRFTLYEEAHPSSVRLALGHDASNDKCKKLIREKLQFLVPSLNGRKKATLIGHPELTLESLNTIELGPAPSTRE